MGRHADNLDAGSNSINNTSGWMDQEEEQNFTPQPDFVVSGDDNRNITEIRQEYSDNYQAQQEMMPESERVWDLHYTPSWFVEEQTNRKNPQYQADTGWTNEQVDAFANYVKGWQEQKPNDWRYGDPGWKADDIFYQDVIKPKEAEYQQAQRDAQIQAQIEQAQRAQYQQSAPPQSTQPQRGQPQSQAPQTMELAIPGTGNQAPMRTQQEIDDIVNNSIYGKMLNIDKSEANFENLPRSGKGIYAWTPSTNGTDVKNAPKSASLTQNIIGAAMSGTGMGAIAKLATGLAGGPAGLVGAGVWFGTSLYSYLRSQGVINNNKATDIADKVIAFTDIGDDIGAGLQGRVAYAFEKIGGDDLTDTSKLGENLGLIAKNIGSFVHYLVAEGPETEYPSQVVSIVNKLVPDIGANAWGIEGSGVSRFARSAISYLVDKPEDKIWLEKGQTTRANSGLPGVYDIPEEMLGTDAYLYWLDFGKYLYDHGVTNTAQLEYEINKRVAEVYGDIANFSQYFEHEMGDLGNSIEAIQPRGMNVYGRITNDTALQTASSANIQPVVNDAIGSIPIVGQVAQFLGLKTSGGVDQVLDSWRNEVLASNPDTLTAADKRIAGLNPDGTLKELNVQSDPNSVKNPFGPNWERFKQQFQTTNEYRATMTGDSIFNVINVAMDDAIRQRPGEDPQASVDRVRNFIDQLENPELIQEHTPLYNISHSVLFNSVKEELSMAIRSRRAEIDAIIADYAKLNNNRAVLNTLAQALGLSPAEVMNKYENEKTTLTQMIINKADQHGGKIPGIDIDVESRAFGDRVISMIAPFAGDDAKAYDPRLVMTQITSKIGDGVTETLVNKYGIQQEGWVYRFGDTIKKMQNLWLLGLSPSYLANNVTNNIVTRTALGFGGFLSNKAIQKWNDRFGFTPERFAESTVGTALDSSKNRDSMTNAEKLRAAIREKRKEGNKFFDKVDKQSDWISQHAGFFGKLSGKVEEMETKQIMTAASMTYMARTWKPGVNFKRMPIKLENAIRAENPDMVDAIYSAISSGVNTDEIEKAIFGTYVVPSAHDALIQAVKNLNMGDAEEVVIDLFAKGGFLAEMNEALKGKMGADIDKVIDDIGERIKAVLQIRLASDIAARAEQVANNVANLSYAEAVKLAQDVSTDMGNVWLNSQMLNSQLFSRRITEGLKSSEFRALYLAQQQILNERWEDVYNTSLQNFKGVVKGLGMGDENRTAFIDAMGQKNSLWVNFYKTKQPQLFQPYLNALTWRTDDTFAKWDSRVKKAWSTYTKAISAEYETTVNKEAKLQQQMDNAFVKGLKEAVSDEAKTRVDSVIVPQLEALRNKRQEIINLNRSIRNDTNKTSYLVEKDLKWKENEARLAELKQQYTQMQAQMYDDILAMGPLTSKPAETNSGDVNHEAQIRADVMERQADDMQKTAENFSETMTDEVAETETAPDLQSTTPDTWEMELNRKNAYKIAKDLGATDDQAVAYSQLNKAHANAWNSNHPGKNYFRDGGGMTVRFTDEARTVPVQGADGTLYQVEAIDRADVNTPEFEAWHGNHPENFNPDGSALTVWHGSDNVFAEFSKDFLGSNTESKSAEMGFFFSKNRKTAASYLTDEIDLDTYYQDELYKKIYDAPEATNWTSVKSDDEVQAIKNRVSDVIEKINKTFPELKDRAENNWLTYQFGITEDGVNKFSGENTQALHLRNRLDAIEKLLADSDTIRKGIEETIEAKKERDNSTRGDLRDPNLNVRQFYLSFDNPLVHDFEGKDWRNVSYAEVIQKAIDNGNDAVILKNTYDGGPMDTIYVVFEPNQIKSVYNSGEFSKETNNVYHQEQEQRIKGQFSIQDGQKVIELFQGSDFSSLIHETSHGWATTLNDNQTEALAAYNGWTAVRYRQLENQWYYEPESMSETDRQAWIDSQERFAYGFETYLAEGKAPNSTMAQLFENFKNFLLDIYKSVRAIVYKGEAIDIHKEQHGVTLAEIFDSMLTGEDDFNIDRTNLIDVDGVNTYLQNETAKHSEKVSVIKADAEEALRMETQMFLDENKKWGLSEAEAYELVTEIMHQLGLNQELSEDVDLMNSVQEKLSRFPGGEKAIRRFINDHRSVAVKISDSAIAAMLKSKNTTETSEAYKYVLHQTEATPEQIQNALTNGGLVPFEQADIANIPKAETKDAQVRKIAQQLLNAELNDPDYGKPRRKGGALLTDVARPHFTLNDYIAYIQNSINEEGAPVLSDETRARLFVNTEIYDPDGSIRQEIQKLRQNLRYKGNVPLNGTFVAQTYSFEHGAYNIVGAVFHDGKLVAYVPDTIPTKTIDIGDGRTAQYIGQSVEHPDQWMYILDGQVYEQNQRQDVQHNPYEAQMPKDSMGAIDPMAQAESEVTYEKILPILEEFKQIYKQNVADAFSNKKFSSLKAETQDLIRGYIENDVRSDLMNTKFKAGKFAETMRDAALLNYNKRYGFDNWLTLLAPYQFWQTRSMWNWIQRMGSKGGKLWRRYARLKELERRNMKEIMPSRTTGKLGWYVPGLPDWMGSLLFMSPTQFGVVGNFIEPIEEIFSDNNALLATAQRFLEDAFRDSKISYQQYLEALDPAKRENSAAWQEAFAKAQEEGYTEKDFGSLWQQYFGMALPLSIGKAVLTGNAQDWNQFPMTRTGTAWRAIFGDNAIGKGGQALLSAPERIIRKAVVEATGNNDFQYKEFGNWGDYYIRQQVWDMVVEGRIDPEQAIQAVIEKDGNNIWDEAGERQRQEILQKTQVLSGIAPVKQMADDIINGRTEKLGEDFGYLLSGVISIITPTTVVREAEQTWRKEANELSNLYAANNKEGQQKFYDEHPNYSMYKNLRYEDDPEQSLRQYLYKAITNVYFDLSKEEKLELNMTLGGDSDAFYRDVISKDTRAIETMDINRLWAYAQAMNGATPYLATDKLREVGVTNPPQYNQAVIPQNEKNAHKVYLEERERLHPGMADVNSVYWKLAPEDRKIFKQYNPGLGEYQKWDSQYKVDHPEIKSYNKRQTAYYNLIQAEEACANFDTLTMQALTLAAHTGKKIDPIYDYYIERAQREVGNTDTLDNFKKILTDYILGR